MRHLPLLALPLLAGCPSDPSDRCGDAGAPTLQLGRWDGEAFVPFSDGEVIEAERGMQGGQHLVVSVLATHLRQPRRAEVGVVATDEAGAEVMAFDTRYAFACEGASVGLVAPWQTVFLDDPAAVHDRDLTLTVEVASGGQRATATSRVHVLVPWLGPQDTR